MIDGHAPYHDYQENHYGCKNLFCARLHLRFSAVINKILITVISTATPAAIIACMTPFLHSHSPNFTTRFPILLNL
jgi:hypothetical protein